MISAKDLANSSTEAHLFEISYKDKKQVYNFPDLVNLKKLPEDLAYVLNELVIYSQTQSQIKLQIKLNDKMLNFQGFCNSHSPLRIRVDDAFKCFKFTFNKKPKVRFYGFFSLRKYKKEYWSSFINKN